MSPSPTIAVAHYPEGAGHATRMLAVANALEAAGADVSMAGGGAGTQFVALNGYDEFEPTTVDYIDTFQDGSMWQVVSESVPATAGRVTDYVEWLRSLDPDALVTDDMFAAIAATRTDVPLYVLKHDMPGLYHSRIERAGASFHTRFQLSAAREFFYPTVWPKSDAEPDGLKRVAPIALDGEGCERDAPDVVVVPSHYSELGRIADNLARQGYDVLDVGSDEWSPVPSLLPYIRAADVVVCSGYSTVMDAAVAGTPCVVFPVTDEQRAVADWLERFDVTGFAIADEPLDVLEAVASPPPAPSFENGAGAVADAVLADLQETPPTASGTDDTVAPERPETPDAQPAAERRSSELLRLRSLRLRVGDRVVAGAAATMPMFRGVAHRARSHAGTAKEAGADAVATTHRLTVRVVRETVERAVAFWAGIVRTVRLTTSVTHRYATALIAFLTAVSILTRGGIRRKRTRFERLASRTVESVRTAAGRLAASGRRVTGAIATAGNDALRTLAELTSDAER